MNSPILYARNAFLTLTATILLASSAAAQNAVVQETGPAPATTATEPAAIPTPTPGATASPVATPVTPPQAIPVETTTAPARPKPAPVARAVTPATPAAPKLVNLAPPANRFSDGVMYVAHRFYEEKGGGWGWIKKEGDSWSSAKWVALKEDPFRGIFAPSRKMSSRNADQDYEYRMTGRYSDKLAYDPHLDESLPIFVIESYQSLGPAKPLDRKPGPPERFTRSKKSRSSSRDDRPVIAAPDSDHF